jgi:hypothetical protein
MNTWQIARALGWFSVGLGVAQILAPRRVSQSVGVGDRSLVMQLMGAREVASGIGLLSGRHTPAWLWARVAGDAIDLALLGTNLVASKHDRGRTAAAAAAVAGVTFLDTWSARRASGRN